MHYDPILCMNVPNTGNPNGGHGYNSNKFKPATVVNTRDAKPMIGKTYEVMGKKFKVIKINGDNVTVVGQNGIVNHLKIDMFNNAKALDSKTIDQAIKAMDKTEFDPQDVQYIRRAIGSLKTANSVLGMINEPTINKVKDMIAKSISSLENAW